MKHRISDRYLDILKGSDPSESVETIPMERKAEIKEILKQIQVRENVEFYFIKTFLS